MLKVLLTKYKENAEIEFAPVYSDFTTKTVIGSEDSLDESFQEVFNKIDHLISERSGCMIESVDGEYVNVSISSPLSGSLFPELPIKLRNSKKGLINIKNDNNSDFMVLYQAFKSIKNTSRKNN